MKFAGKLLVVAGLLGFLAFQSACSKKKTEPEPVTDQQLDVLTKTPWKASKVILNNTDVTSSQGYTNFALTMTGTKGQTIFGFSTQGRPSLSAWPSTGNFQFDTAAPATLLSRNDTPPVAVTYSVTSAQLTMHFQYSGTGYQSKTSEVAGVWDFTFVPSN